MRYASKLGMMMAGAASALAMTPMSLLHRMREPSGPGQRVSTYRGRTTRFKQHCGQRQRDRYARQNAMQRQLESHKGEHTVKPRHIFGGYG